MAFTFQNRAETKGNSLILLIFIYFIYTSIEWVGTSITHRLFFLRKIFYIWNSFHPYRKNASYCTIRATIFIVCIYIPYWSFLFTYLSTSTYSRREFNTMFLRNFRIGSSWLDRILLCNSSTPLVYDSTYVTGNWELFFILIVLPRCVTYTKMRRRMIVVLLWLLFQCPKLVVEATELLAWSDVLCGDHTNV